MNISEALDFLNFWIGKEKGAYFTVSELENLLDNGQMAYYSDIKARYATSQLIKEILSPFKRNYDFTPSDTISGYIVIPSDSDYLDLLSLQIQYQISNTTVYVAVPVVNEDERADKLRSQVDPVTITSPFAEMFIPRFIKLYPTAGYTGTATYLKRPIRPVFAYTLISGRAIVYDPVNSVQMEWRVTEQVPVLLKALSSMGINLSDQQVSQFAEIKTASNYQGINHL